MDPITPPGDTVNPENPQTSQNNTTPADVNASKKSGLNIALSKVVPAKMYRRQIATVLIIAALALSLPLAVRYVVNSRTAFQNRASTMILTGEPTPSPTPTPTSTPTPTQPPGCKQALQTMKLLPSKQMGYGGSLRYDLTVKNNNSKNCRPEYYSGKAYSPSRGWRGSPPTFTVSLNSGETRTYGIWFTPPTPLPPPGSYKGVVDLTGPKGTTSATVIYTLQFNPTPTSTPFPTPTRPSSPTPTPRTPSPTPRTPSPTPNF